MKRFILAVILSFVAGVSWAVSDVWQSTNTATADTAKSLCSNSGSIFSRAHAVVHNVCVNTGAAGTFTIYNSSAVAVNPVAAINTAAAICMEYDVSLSSGLSYTNSATANVTMTYICR
jgi:hypothetical protein